MGPVYRCRKFVGLYQRSTSISNPSVQTTLKFINEDASSVHGAVRVSSVYTSESGEWKLGGFDILSSMKEDDAIIYVRLS